jgi:hypothetical protein
MHAEILDTILLVCDCERNATQIISRLHESGFNVVGPVSTASMALAMAAQAGTTLALVASPPTGRRGVSELADDLMRLWGVRSWVLQDASQGDDTSGMAWAAPPNRVASITRALKSLPARPRGDPREMQ